MITAAQHLIRIATLWPHLDDALDQHTTGTWPPSGRLADYLNTLDRTDAAAIHHQRLHRIEHPTTGRPWYECVGCNHVGDGNTHPARGEERDPQQIGETPAPVSLLVLDTARLVEGTLVHLADTLAPAITRQAAPHAPADWQTRGWTTADRDRRNALAEREQGDPRRWRYTGLRTAEYAAGWLHARVTGQDGPFWTLTAAQLLHVEQVAAGCADRIAAALDLDARDIPNDRPCPRCSGRLLLTTGAGRPPTARCEDCASTWALPEPVAA
ncbi:hypothetical protein [Streptomyces sp. H27-H5]|uniref:hypothetical protein n=1 Tax=Streptomyces sp. H27-H5 TaxID=2996460 RepID=UPI0022710F8C|nr:hypothetical protein [Streptomyces sp. H27-H5]MCY0960838.1 hypothetical protein [Streptomyces sp. H27-H5]